MKKIILGIVAAVVVAVGGATGYTYMQSSSNHTSHTTTKSSSSAKSSSQSSSTSSSSAAQSSQPMSSSTSVPASSQSQDNAAINPQTGANYDPNKTLNGTEVTSTMIQSAQQQLIQAGLPADQWAPSDIKKIITNSSQEGVSIVDYARANFHA